MPSDSLTFLTTARGKAFTAAGFTNYFRKQCKEAGLARRAVGAWAPHRRCAGGWPRPDAVQMRLLRSAGTRHPVRRSATPKRPIGSGWRVRRSNGSRTIPLQTARSRSTNRASNRSKLRSAKLALVGAQEAACAHRINDISAQTSPKSHIGAKRQLSGVTNFAATNATEELGAIAPSTLQTDVLRAIPAKAGTNAVAGAGPTAPSPPRTDTLRAMLVKATKRRRRPA
jgi:hypothetical protein